MDDSRIEAVARRVCTDLGKDPEVRVAHHYGDDMTPAERGDLLFAAIPLPPVPQWRLYRGQAAEALAKARILV